MIVLTLITLLLAVVCFVLLFKETADDNIITAILLGIFGVVLVIISGCLTDKYAKAEKTIKCSEYNIEKQETFINDSIKNITYIIHYKK